MARGFVAAAAQGSTRKGIIIWLTDRDVQSFSLEICCGAMHARMSAWDCAERSILTSGTSWIFSALAHKKEILIVTG
jgi:hypothetical protein